jgi:hypothetical protein
MKLFGIASAVAAAGLGVAIASRAESPQVVASHVEREHCAAAATAGGVPRAALKVENRLGRPLRLWLEARSGPDLVRTEIGVIDAAGERMFRQALPAGRNLLVASADGDARGARRQVLYVTNRGPETCTRRYLWRVE